MRRPSQRHFAPENLDPRLRAGLVGHWIGGGSGLTWFDRSGYGDHGALTNGPTWGLSRDGNRSALNLDGVNDYALMSKTTTGYAGTQSHAFAALIRWDDPQPAGAPNDNYRWVINNRSSSLVIGSSAVPKVRFFYNGTVSVVTGTTTITAGWHHIAASYDASTGVVSLYLDGRLDSTHTIVTWSATSGQRNIGSLNGTYALKAGIDDVRIYARTLSAADVALLAQPAFLPVVPRRWFVGPSGTITTAATAAYSTWVAPSATAQTRYTVAATAASSTWTAPNATAQTRYTVSAFAALSTWVAPSATAQLARRRSIAIAGSRASYSIAGSRASYHIEGS